jgi:hypothetical protein
LPGFSQVRISLGAIQIAIELLLGEKIRYLTTVFPAPFTTIKALDNTAQELHECWLFGFRELNGILLSQFVLRKIKKKYGKLPNLSNT